MIWFAALGIAYGITFLTAFPFRTIRFPQLFWGTFAFTYAVCFAALYAAKLPAHVVDTLGVTGTCLGLVLTILWRITSRFERANMAPDIR